MNPRVKAVIPQSGYKLLLTFTNNEQKIFDVSPYLEKGIFVELQNELIFNTVKPCLGSIEWCNGADLCPDMLFEDSVTIKTNP